MSKHRRLWIIVLLLVIGAQLGATSSWSVAQPTCSPDVNSDLMVDLFDLVRVSSKYGTHYWIDLEPRPPEDTNADGRVDITDLVCVSAHFGHVFELLPTQTPSAVATPTATLPAPAACEWARVEWVTDGDTIRVQLGGKMEYVRYINIDTPESYEPYGDEATTMNVELVGSKDVCLERDPGESRDRDRYDRLLRYVWVGGLLAEAELVQAGLAEVVSYRPGYQYESWLLMLQAEAQRQGRGMWE